MTQSRNVLKRWNHYPIDHHFVNWRLFSQNFYKIAGSSPGDNLVLRQVLAVIRHGDRSPLNHKLYKRLRVVPKYCRLDPGKYLWHTSSYKTNKWLLLPGNSPSEESLARFVKTIPDDQRSMLKGGEKLLISPIPSSKICGSGMLSQLGVVSVVLFLKQTSSHEIFK